jgi:hypothetical protein
MMKRKNQFNARSKYWKYYIGRSIDFSASKRFREYKGEESMVVMDLTFVMELLLFLPKGENRWI